MARKKKEVVETKQKAGVAYTGKVKIQFIKNNRVYKTIDQHNEGTTELFKYLANCIIGNYNQGLRPQYIHTYYCENTQAALDPANENARYKLWETTGANPASKSTCPINIAYNTVSPELDKTSSSVIFKPCIGSISFMIPAQQISGKTNVICLYNTAAWSNSTVPLAYIVLSEKEAKQFEVEENNTSNILVTWELAVSNKEA